MADNNPAATAAANAEYTATNPNTFVPTKAPTAPSATPPENPASSTADTGKPTAIVGSGQAASFVNSTIKPAYSQAQQDLATQNAKLSYGFMDGSQYDVNGNEKQPPVAPNSGSTGSTSGNTITPPANPETTPGTPEYQLLNTPEPGYHFEYAPDGTRTQVINGTNQPGYSLTPPTPITATNEVTQSNGTIIKQMSDGSYASYNAAGAYQGPATKKDFDDATTANQLSASIAQLANGTYPLTAAEQAQVNALQDSFKQLIKEQEIANANLTGGTTVAMNLYGVGNTIMGLGTIKGTIDSGLAKIADLNGKMASAVAQMEDSFRKDDMVLLKDAYDTLTTAQKDRQAALDKIKTDTDTQAKDMRDYNEKVKVDQQNEAHQQFLEKMQSAQFDEQKKKDAFEEYIQQADLDEKKKMDAIDAYYKGVTASHEAATLALEQAKVTGVYTDPKTGEQSLTVEAQKLLGANSAAISTALNQTVSVNPKTGKPIAYVDGTGLTDEQKAAAKSQGLIVVSKENMPTMNAIKNTQEMIGSLLSQLQQQGVIDANGNFTGKQPDYSGLLYQTPTSTFQGSLNTTIKDLQTKGLPNTGDLIQVLNSNKLSKNESVSDLQHKITNIKNALDNAQNFILTQGLSTNQPQTMILNGKTLTLQPDGTYQ